MDVYAGQISVSPGRKETEGGMPHIEYETGIFMEKFLCVCE